MKVTGSIFGVEDIKYGSVIKHIIGQVIIDFQLIFYGCDGLFQCQFREVFFPFQDKLICWMKIIMDLFSIQSMEQRDVILTQKK